MIDKQLLPAWASGWCTPGPVSRSAAARSRGSSGPCAQFLGEIGSGRELDHLTQLNILFTAWVETVYHRRVHSETGQTPLARFSAGDPPTMPSPRSCARRS